MRIKSPVLVPFHGAAHIGQLEVEFVAIARDRRAEQLADDSEQLGMTDGLPIHGVLLDRVFQPAETRLLRRVAGLEIEDGVVDGDRA